MAFSMHAPPSVAGCGMVAIWFEMGYYEGPAWGQGSGASLWAKRRWDLQEDAVSPY